MFIVLVPEVYSTIPCPILEDLIRIYKMDLEMFDYEVESFRKICEKSDSGTAM